MSAGLEKRWKLGGSLLSIWNSVQRTLLLIQTPLCEARRATFVTSLILSPMNFQLGVVEPNVLSTRVTFHHQQTNETAAYESAMLNTIAFRRET
jgi:hypothetical protein